MRMARALLVTTTLLACAAAVLPAEADAKTRRVKAPVTFHLALSKAEYKQSEPIEATLSLENKGKRAVWVNTRFHVNDPTRPPDDREVVLEVTGPDGKPVPCTYSYPTGFPKSEYFQLLPGGQTATAEHPRDLRTYFNFSTPGRYTVVSVYDNVFGAELGLPAFTGPATSKPVTVTIIE